MRKPCTITGTEFEVSEQEQLLLEKLNNQNPLIKGSIGLPTIHPLENLRRFAAWGNARWIFSDKSCVSGKPMITRFNPELGYKSCTQEEFWSDDLDNIAVGKPYDFSRSFFGQFDELMHNAVHLSLNNNNNENAEWTNGTYNLKKCYLVFDAMDTENSYYCYTIRNSSDCIDCVMTIRSQNCYSCVAIENCMNCKFTSHSDHSSGLFGCVDLVNCHDCFGCVGLRHQSYCLFNEQKTKEEYEEFIKMQNLESYQSSENARKRCEEFIKSVSHTFNTLKNVENSSGYMLTNCHNTTQSFFSDTLDDCGYLFLSQKAKDCWQGWAYESELSYLSGIGNSYNVLYSYGISNGNSIIYSYMLFQNSSNCFGCVGLKNKSYCILNKQYTKEEYEELLPRIIEHMKSTGEWGNFFPPMTAPEYAEESFVGDIFQIESPQGLRERGYRVRQNIRSKEIVDVSHDQLPDIFTTEMAESMSGQKVRCAITGEYFTFQKGELAFYLQNHIPLPRYHWKERMQKLYATLGLIPNI